MVAGELSWLGMNDIGFLANIQFRSLSLTHNCRDYLVSSVVELEYNIIQHTLDHVGLLANAKLKIMQY